MTRSPGPRKTVKLSDSVHQRLNMYALAATAAGVSVLACSPGAEAKVVTQRIGVSLEGNTSYSFNPTGQNAVFNFNASFLNHEPYSFWNRVFLQAQSSGAFFVSGHHQLPAALRTGSRIGRGRHFAKGPSYGGLLFTYGNYGGTRNHHQGNFDFSKVAFVGFKFSISGKEHFGWLRLKIAIRGHFTLTHLIDYGYETIPGKSIAAGQTKDLADTNIVGRSASFNTSAPTPASLGVLALGAPGLSIWRRKESAVASVERS